MCYRENEGRLDHEGMETRHVTFWVVPHTLNHTQMQNTSVLCDHFPDLFGCGMTHHGNCGVYST